MGSIHEKNQGPKISCYCTFNVAIISILYKEPLFFHQNKIVLYEVVVYLFLPLCPQLVPLQGPLDEAPHPAHQLVATAHILDMTDTPHH